MVAELRPQPRNARSAPARRGSLRWIALVCAVLGLVVGVSPTALADHGGPHVTLLVIDDAITPVTATYVDRGIERAIDRGHSAVVIQLDTPGGLSSAMDAIIRDILASPIPVIVYVAPDGARAASAGMYITYAAHVAAMAPTSNIGSATPIQLGQAEDTELTASERKVINDAVAQVRALAELRGRNADWAESAVRDAANVTASEAVRLGVVDFIATNMADLLEQSNGREVLVQGNLQVVNTAGAVTERTGMSFFERVLQVVSNPNIAFILLSLGTLALVFELANPGLILPGVAGGLAMLLGFYSLGTLDTNWAGLALLVFAFVLWIVEVFVPSHGILTIGGVIAFILGGLMLSNTRNDQVLQLSRWVIFTVALLLGLFFLTIVAAAARSRKIPVSSGATGLIGVIGVARTDLDPTGMVFLQGELWEGTSVAGPVRKGEQVRVTALRGIRLDVEPVGEPGQAPPASTWPQPA
ncbi:MAG: peptidase [Chloroflexi bacterium]|nr:MAG: peptidase [Chloroflexota bacterium]